MWTRGRGKSMFLHNIETVTVVNQLTEFSLSLFKDHVKSEFYPVHLST